MSPCPDRYHDKSYKQKPDKCEEVKEKIFCNFISETFEELLQNIDEAVEGCMSVDIDIPLEDGTQILEIVV